MSDMAEKVKEFVTSARYNSSWRVQSAHHSKCKSIIRTLLDVVEGGEAFIDKCDAMAPEINDRIVHCELVRKFKPLSQNWSKEHKSFRDALTTFEQRIGEILEGGNDDIL